jgi:hypothetical protein
VVVSLRNRTRSAAAQLFFTTAANASWSQSKSNRIAISPNSRDYTTYTFDMSTVPEWIGTITDLRTRPGGGDRDHRHRLDPNRDLVTEGASRLHLLELRQQHRLRLSVRRGDRLSRL